MPRRARKFLIVCGVVASAFLITLLGINLYLQSEGVQTRIRQAASTSLGATIRTGGSSYTPWGGFAISHIVVPDPESPSKTLLEAASLRIRFALLPLLRGRLQIREIVLSDPLLTARQDAQGNWVLLVPPPPREEIPVTLPERAPGQPGRSFKIFIERIRVQNGRADFLDSKGRSLGRIEGADLNAAVHDGKSSSGDLRIGDIFVADALRLRNLAGPFTWDGSALDLPAIHGILASGTLEGAYHLETGETPAFESRWTLNGAKLKKLASEAGINAQGTSGLLNGHLELSGDPENPESFAGMATLNMTGARFVPLDFLVQFGQMFGIEELQTLRLNEATSAFQIAKGQVRIESVRLKSENLILTGTGTADFDGSLNVDAALHVNKKLQRNLVRGIIGKNFRQSEDPEYKRLDFRVTNTLAQPRTDLLEKLIDIKVGEDLGGLINNLFGAPKPKKGNDKADD